MRVWLVEDSATDAFVIEEALRTTGLAFDVNVMRDGELAMQAVSNAAASPPDLVLLDLNLPRVPGLQVLAALRQVPELREVPVIVVTSSDYKGDRDAASAHGATAYFTKPHDLDEFLTLGEIVRSVL